MRFLIVASLAESLVNFREHLIVSLIGAGHEVWAAAPSINEDIATRLTGIGANHIETNYLRRRGLNPLYDLAYVLQLKKIMSVLNPDLVITYTAKPNIWGSIAAAINGNKVASLVTGIGTSLMATVNATYTQRLLRALTKALYKVAMRRVSTLVFQNPDDLKDFLSMGIISDFSRVAIINGSGVSLHDFPFTSMPKKNIFLMASRLLRSKGVAEYAAAAKIVKSKYPLADFYLVGWEETAVEADNITLGELDELSGGAITYSGVSTNIRRDMQLARFYVLPSYREGTPRSVLEAMATGRPIVVADVPGSRETVIDDHNGYLAQPRDTVDLASKMIRLIERPQEAERMAANSRRMAEQKYDVELVTQSLLEALEIPQRAPVNPP